LVAAAVSVDTGVSEPTVPMDTANSGGVTVSGSLVVKKSSVLATVPTYRYRRYRFWLSA